MTFFAPQPKPRQRLLAKRERARAQDAALRKMRADVKRRAGGRCEICGKPGSETHHILPRSQGGKHTAENGAYLCGRPCHEDVTHHVIKVFGRDARGRLLWERVG